MIDLKFELPAINPEGLDMALRAALNPAIYIGLSTSGTTATVHIDDSSTGNDENIVQGVIKNHDPSVLTPEQQMIQQSTADKVTLIKQLAADINALNAIAPTDQQSTINAVNQIAKILAMELGAIQTLLG